MNIEQIIQAKTRYYQVDALLSICGGGAILVVCLLVLTFCWIKRKDCNSELAQMMAHVFGVMALLFVLVGTWLYATANIKARANAANYNLIELNK